MKSFSALFFSIVIFLNGPLAVGQETERIREDRSFVNFESPHVHPIDLSSQGKWLAACNTANATVELFDVSGGGMTPVGSIPVGLDPVSVRFRTDRELWVVNHVSDSISIIDAETRAVIRVVKTLDEPADVVFAGKPTRAFVTCSQVNTIQVFDPVNWESEPVSIPIEGEDPRALAVSPDGEMVYAAVYESGNGTTVLGGGLVDEVFRDYPPNAVDHPGGPYNGRNPAPNNGTEITPQRKLWGLLSGTPKTSLIVRRDGKGKWLDDNDGDWSAYVSGELARESGRREGWDLADHDVAIIDAESLSVSYASGLMNICMALDVHPKTGEVTVVGTEAMNHIRFEPNLKGVFLRVQQARFAYEGSGGVSNQVVEDLNPHLNYEVPTLPQDQRNLSLGDPRAIVWSPTGEEAYIAGMGSNNIVVTNGTGQRSGGLAPIEVGEGPTGLALEEETGRLFVLNRFGASISIIDTETRMESSRTPFFDPTPDRVRAGRRHFYDTHKSSGLGHTSCASCHVDGRMDRLAWDLGDPSAEREIGEGLTVLTASFRMESKEVEIHPMKGPMVTATLQGIMGNEPFHWRGDKNGLEDFNIFFQTLLGDDAQLAEGEILELKQFLATLHFPPNPHRTTENELKEEVALPGQFSTDRFGNPGVPLETGNAVLGERLFEKAVFAGTNRACSACHFGTPGMSYPVSSSRRFNSPDGLRFLSDLVGSDDGPF
ncbi:MAG: hypothetical protein AAF514_03650, partial [Verrucomicrobiota bacterium]